jgi:RecB family endonuclease NucS
VKYLGKGTNKTLDESIIGNSQVEWLGNEVSCGVGMQRIDVMPSLIENGQRVLVPIELKAVEAKEGNIIQIQRYINWIEQYYMPNCQSDIQPLLVTRKIANKQRASYQMVVRSFQIFNQANAHRCRRLKYVEFSLVNGDLLFEVVNY